MSGLGIGASAIIAPAYLAELAPAQHRGAMVQVRVRRTAEWVHTQGSGAHGRGTQESTSCVLWRNAAAHVAQVYEVMLCIGMFISTVVDWALQHAGPHGWRWMVGLPAIPGAAIGLALLILPESPRCAPCLSSEPASLR